MERRGRIPDEFTVTVTRDRKHGGWFWKAEEIEAFLRDSEAVLEFSDAVAGLIRVVEKHEKAADE